MSGNAARVPKRRRSGSNRGEPDVQRPRHARLQGDIGSSTQNEMVLSDPGLFDCPICLDPITPPVYQCVQGHLVCEPCSNKISRCHSCRNSDGFNRCIAVEKILESTKVSCPNRRYGCQLKLTYNEKLEHEKSCIFTRCSCPVSECSYVGMSSDLYNHLSTQHSAIVHNFHMNVNTPCLFLKRGSYLFLKESHRGTLFVVKRSVEPLGSLFSVVCIAPPSSRAKYSYQLTACAGDKEISLKSSVIVAPKCSAEPPKKNCLLITSDFADDHGSLVVHLILKKLD